MKRCIFLKNVYFLTYIDIAVFPSNATKVATNVNVHTCIQKKKSMSKYILHHILFNIKIKICKYKYSFFLYFHKTLIK